MIIFSLVGIPSGSFTVRSNISFEEITLSYPIQSAKLDITQIHFEENVNLGNGGF
jgi:hypothetical protein